MQRTTTTRGKVRRDARAARTLGPAACSPPLAAAFLLLTATFSLLAAPAALAQRIENPIAVFNGLDKITGRIVSFEVGIGETVQFGALQLTPRACYTRPATETPNTTAFLEVDEVDADGRAERLFTGWVFAASPGLHGIEHPVYDIWLTDCENPNAPPEVPSPDAGAEGGAAEGGAGTPDPNAPPLPPERPGRRPDASAPAEELEALSDEPLALEDPLFAPIGE
ncbi:DUF2155 domain-containing protein [Pseudochelatococcus sp. B33]